MSGSIPVFRANDIQAYTPPAAPKKPAEEPPAATTTPPAPPTETVPELGDLTKYDTDGNGKITKDEFNATRGGDLLRAKADQDKELFKKLDANGDGKLSSDEFLNAFTKLAGDSGVAKARDRVDGEFNQRKASDGTIHVQPRVQAGGGTTATQQAPTTKEHTVRAGDTMNKIAKANGVTMADLKEANPELFKNGKDSQGKTRTAGGDLIYPGDKIKIPTKPKPGEGDKPGALGDKDAVKFLQDNFDQVAGPDGRVSQADLAKLPDGPGKQALVKHFDSLIFASVDQGKEAWSNLTKQDVQEIAKQLGTAGSLDKVAEGLAQKAIKDNGVTDKNGDGKVDATDLSAYVRSISGETAPPMDDKAALKYVQDNFAKIAGPDGMISRTDLVAHLPQAPGLEGLVKNFDSLMFASIDQGKDSWSNLTKKDIEAVGKKLGEAGSLDKVAEGLTQQVIKDKGIKDTTGDGKVDVADLRDFIKANGGGQPDGNQATLLLNVDSRIATLQGERDGLVKDLADPRKQAEAMARMRLLDSQIAQLQNIRRKVGEFRPAENQSAEDAAKTQEIFAQIDGMVKDLSNPTKMGDVRARLAVAYNLLQNPKLYDRNAPGGTTNPVLNAQAATVGDLNQRVRNQLNEMDGLIADLARPERAAEAQARLNLLYAQMQTLMKIENQVGDYRLPANLNADQTRRAADLLKQIDAQVANLSNPTKTAEAQAQIQRLMTDLQKIGR